MSEIIETPKELTAVEKAKQAMEQSLAEAKKRNDAIAARVKELETNVGKTFKPKGESITRIKVVKFSGVHKFGNVPCYTFEVESKHPQCAYLVAATKFLEKNEAVEVKPEIVQEII